MPQKQPPLDHVDKDRNVSLFPKEAPKRSSLDEC